ncbi:MAG: NAD(P)/FAD-dependent oxidoreductase [Oscillospiraceae bacterium]|nr:NAD(P)/FAD-dependent oxidoreductase [Oscillospiraceae bacterium]
MGKHYDIAIIGAGVVGGAVARELTRTELSVCVIERECDVGCGASKANSGIVHAGFDAKNGTLMAKLNVRGNELYERMCSELSVPFKRNGSLVLGFSEEDRRHLEDLRERGIKNGVGGLEILPRDKCPETNLSDDVEWVLHAPSAGIVDPMTLTVALCENAARNGADFLLGHAVRAVERTDDTWTLTVGSYKITADYVINAAGAGAPALSVMAGGVKREQILRRGEYCLLDKSRADLVKHTIFQTPGKMGKGVLVTPTVDGNILIGPTALDTSYDTATTREGQSELLKSARRSIRDVPQRDIINSFSGIRAIVGDDFVIEEAAEKWLDIMGICSPGLTAAPAIALYARELLGEKDARFAVTRGNFEPIRKGIPKSGELPHYGRVVCRCENVTEGEIIAAVRGIIPATTVDGVKRRVRAGMGRCQGGFCLTRILEIIARETGVELNEVTKSGGASFVAEVKIR